jgi:polyisoprenoid-binding protein YceI
MVTSPSFSEEFEIDGTHSRVGFKVKHLGISNVAGQFSDFSGSITFDPKNIPASTTSASLKVKSINTSQEKRDNHLKSDDFFSEAKFPFIKFVSKSVSVKDDKNFIVNGDLTIRDVTRPVSLSVEYLGSAKDLFGKDRVAFLGTTKINRKDYGLTWSKLIETGALVVGDEITIELEIQGIKKA